MITEVLNFIGIRKDEKVEEIIKHKEDVISTLRYFFINPINIVDIKLSNDCDTEITKGVWVKKVNEPTDKITCEDLEKYNIYECQHLKGSLLSAHYHNKEKIMTISGSVNLYVYNTETHKISKAIELNESDEVSISSYIPHAIKALEDSKILIFLTK